MLGNPKFKREDLVVFTAVIDGKEQELKGAIHVVDANGTAEQQEEPSYDIHALYEGEIVLFKHIRESLVRIREDF